MTWPTTQVVSNDLITASQINSLPVRLAEVELAAAASNFDFILFPNQYAHYLVHITARSNGAGINAQIRLRLNGDASPIYTWIYIYSAATGISVVSGLANDSILIGHVPGASAAGGVWGQWQILLPDFSSGGSSLRKKIVVSEGGWAQHVTSGNQVVAEGAGGWDSNSSVYRLELYPSAGSWVAPSSCALYGLG